MRQLSLLPKPITKTIHKTTKAHGGSLAKKGKRKTARPIDTSKPIHLVLRSKEHKLFKSMLFVEYYTEKFAEKFDIKIYRKATVSNHIHLLIKADSRQCYIRFVRALTGALTIKLNAKWECLPYTRVVTWGREFQVVENYVAQNMLEAFGAIPYTPRKKTF